MKEQLKNFARLALISGPIFLSGCKNTDLEIKEPETDFSKYVPMVASMRDPETYCPIPQSVVEYREGEIFKLLDPSQAEPKLLEFEITTDKDRQEAGFRRVDSKYTGFIHEGNVFGILEDPEGKGASPVGKLVRVSSNSIAIVLVKECTEL